MIREDFLALERNDCQKCCDCQTATAQLCIYRVIYLILHPETGCCKPILTPLKV